MLCASCTVSVHQINPMHRVEVSLFSHLVLYPLSRHMQCWNGSYFEPSTLQALGLRIQLGHGINGHCINPIAAPGDDFVIIDCNGIHKVALDYCGCTSAAKETVQLLRARLYPATVKAPQTAATFNMLEFFQLLTFDSKASAFEYYHALTRRTDNTGTIEIPVRSSIFLLITHLLTLLNLRIDTRNSSG